MKQDNFVTKYILRKDFEHNLTFPGKGKKHSLLFLFFLKKIQDNHFYPLIRYNLRNI